MATVNGTSGNDFIHVAGDGHAAPAGYTDNPGATDGDDTINGGDGNDIIYTGAGNDTVSAGADNDKIFLGANFTATDKIDGGTGTDEIVLQGDYSAGVNIANSTLTGVEEIFLKNGFDYALTTASFVNSFFTLNASDLDAAHHFTFDSSAETTHPFTVIDGAGDDTIRLGGGNDVVYLAGGGVDTVQGGAGDDLVIVSKFVAGDSITSSSGLGHDTIEFNGNFAGAIDLNTITIQGYETISFAAGHDYRVLGANALISGTFGTPTYDATALGARNHLVLDLSGDSTVATLVLGGAGADTITDSALDDQIIGNAGNDLLEMTTGGNDTVSGGAGNDVIDFGTRSPGASHIDGGDGNDTLKVGGGNMGGYLNSIETIDFGPGTYNLQNGLSIAGTTHVRLDASDLGADQRFLYLDRTPSDGIAYTELGGAGGDMLGSGDGNDVISGGTGDDVILLGLGNDTVSGGAGDDTIDGGGQGTLTTADHINGGSGNDVLNLQGTPMSGTLNVTASMLVGVETLAYGVFDNFHLIIQDGVVPTARTMTIDGFTTTAGVQVIDASAVTDGHLAMVGGTGNDTFIGGALGDSFDISGGGTDIVSGGAGDDLTQAGDAFDRTDKIAGGDGNDTLVLAGADYAGGVHFAPANLSSIETLKLASADAYDLLMNDANVAAGQVLTVDATAAGALTFDGHAETNGGYIVLGSIANDTILGGAGNDVIAGGLGADDLTGGPGNDIYRYASARESTSTVFDTIHGFDFAGDSFDLPVAVTGIDTAVTTGLLTTAHFDANLRADLSSLEVGHAVLFTPDSGDYVGDTFLVVDANGVAGYQPKADFVVLLDGPANLADLSTGSFT